MPRHRPGRSPRPARRPGHHARDMAAGLWTRLGRLVSIEDGTATEEDKTFYRTWLSRIEGWSPGHRHLELQRARNGGRLPNADPAGFRAATPP